ncbi:diacylglycerol/lipid kinase family protein [Leptospira idonii]|uniref:Diacylglycerol kinase family lipid kinase n=1 Tax=Leptospira idonii TaxID=1193500 RepID=A0A4R9M0X2_9LEPT|nr:diacylglycerol kinase family protein [Leptospira idonii]TGN19692.1 diacylglycerol kinase family lipid kinase [Leptospira idonii]
MKAKIILNPVSGGGVAGKVWKTVQKELEASNTSYDFEETTPDLPARDIASKALENGYKWIIGIGGDGTLSNIVNGFFRNGKPIAKDAIFSPIPAGRGNDFVKTVKVNKNPKLAIKQVLNGAVRKIDLIDVTYTKNDKSKGQYYCLNLADFGMGGEVVYKVNKSNLGKILGGKAVFLLYSFLCLFTYKNKVITLKLGNKEVFSSKSRIVVCANGEYAGGGMWFAPKAKLDDGLFDLLMIKDVGILKAMQKSLKLYQGTVSEDEQVTSRQTNYIEADSDEDVFIDVDGENMGQLPATFQVLPQALSIKC